MRKWRSFLWHRCRCRQETGRFFSRLPLQRSPTVHWYWTQQHGSSYFYFFIIAFFPYFWRSNGDQRQGRPGGRPANGDRADAVHDTSTGGLGQTHSWPGPVRSGNHSDRADRGVGEETEYRHQTPHSACRRQEGGLLLRANVKLSFKWQVKPGGLAAIHLGYGNGSGCFCRSCPTLQARSRGSEPRAHSTILLESQIIRCLSSYRWALLAR